METFQSKRAAVKYAKSWMTQILANTSNASTVQPFYILFNAESYYFFVVTEGAYEAHFGGKGAVATVDNTLTVATI